MNKNTLVSFAIIVIVALGIVFTYSLKSETPYNQETLKTFAMCLANKKITMYGAAWCTHCQAQKALFGQAFESVPYIECPQNEKLCLDRGIKGYPTWITTDGTKYEGEQSLSKLAQITSCPL